MACLESIRMLFVEVGLSVATTRVVVVDAPVVVAYSTVVAVGCCRIDWCWKIFPSNRGKTKCVTIIRSWSHDARLPMHKKENTPTTRQGGVAYWLRMTWFTYRSTGSEKIVPSTLCGFSRLEILSKLRNRRISNPTIKFDLGWIRILFL